MAVHQTKKQSDLEKRLKLLRQSLSVTERTSETKSYQLPSKSTASSTPKSNTDAQDVLYLKKDLVKITILSVLAFAVQAGLHFALTNNLIKLPF